MNDKPSWLVPTVLACAVCVGAGFAAGMAWERLHQPFSIEAGVVRLEGPQELQLGDAGSGVSLSATPDLATIEVTRHERRAALEADVDGARVVVADGTHKRIEVALTNAGGRIRARSGPQQAEFSIPADGGAPILTFGAEGEPKYRCTLGPTEAVCDVSGLTGTQ